MEFPTSSWRLALSSSKKASRIGSGPAAASVPGWRGYVASVAPRQLKDDLLGVGDATEATRRAGAARSVKGRAPRVSPCQEWDHRAAAAPTASSIELLLPLHGVRLLLLIALGRHRGGGGRRASTEATSSTLARAACLMTGSAKMARTRTGSGGTASDGAVRTALVSTCSAAARYCLPPSRRLLYGCMELAVLDDEAAGAPSRSWIAASSSSSVHCGPPSSTLRLHFSTSWPQSYLSASVASQTSGCDAAPEA